ncbi:MAG: DUF1653 domain-containing protein [Candidatus Yonathbacteria bacterium]|nr:DUF1653 domain-containing protein [Candidatus Yonathbacteria bacterium]NTW47892.1 DUF1653 domain-containing protein [Candidatus Yonathbacteria bacterium]
MSHPTPGVYRHFKGKEYDLIGVARHSESLEELVIYRGRYDSEEFGPNPLWARSLASFWETVQTPDGEVMRFTKLEDSK